MKYVIDIPNGVLWIQYILQTPTGTQNLKSESVSQLAPYTECDRGVVEDEVWKFAKKVRLKEFFDDNHNLHPYFDYFDSYQDAKAKHEELKKQKAEIHVGDEVMYYGNKHVVVYVGTDEVYHLINETWIREVVQGKHQLTKTGRHFDEMEKLLERMREG